MVTRTYQIWMQPKVGGCNFPVFYLKSFFFFLKKRVAKNKRIDAWQIVRDVPRRSMEGVLVLVVDMYLSFISTSILFLFVFIFLLFPYVFYCLVIVIISIRLNNYNNNNNIWGRKKKKEKKKQQQNNRDRNGLESYRYRKPIDKSHLQSMTHYEGGGTSSSSSSLLKKELDEVH